MVDDCAADDECSPKLSKGVVELYYHHTYSQKWKDHHMDNTTLEFREFNNAYKKRFNLLLSS